MNTEKQSAKKVRIKVLELLISSKTLAGSSFFIILTRRDRIISIGTNVCIEWYARLECEMLFHMEWWAHFSAWKTENKTSWIRKRWNWWTTFPFGWLHSYELSVNTIRLQCSCYHLWFYDYHFDVGGVVLLPSRIWLNYEIIPTQKQFYVREINDKVPFVKRILNQFYNEHNRCMILCVYIVKTTWIQQSSK